jgi:NAD(P)-dependent dehydrogenase (short-subunit alcohol dehydrogenase family)
MDDFSLKGHVAIVTGAGRGFGHAIALLFAEAGADLVLTYRRSAGGCEEIANEVERMGGRCLVQQADVTDDEAVNLLASRAIEDLGKVDVLVNNAGTMHLEGFLESSPAAWRADLDVNVLGTMNVTHAVLPHMVERRFGKIVNLSSQLAISGWERAPVYAGSKGFVLTWTKSLAKELGPYNINVNAIGPGGILTDMNAAVYPDEETKAARVSTLPLRRFGQPRDVATCALFLAAPAGEFLTGQMLGPNGGGVM